MSVTILSDLTAKRASADAGNLAEADAFCVAFIEGKSLLGKGGFLHILCIIGCFGIRAATAPRPLLMCDKEVVEV